MSEQQSVLFDPGFAQHTTILSIGIEYIYARINQFKNLGQRKQQFKMSYPQIVKMVENNVGFCLGCLLWAAYIKTYDNAKIEGNPCLGDTYNRDEAVEEIDFSIEFFEHLRKDVKYYLGADYVIKPVYIEILNLYKEFLELNHSFVNTRTTNDLRLPASFLVLDKYDAIEVRQKIQEVILSGRLLDLLDSLYFIYRG